MTTVFSKEEGTGEVILLIHGFPFHQGIWDDYSPLLSDDFRVIKIDLPGFGKSPGLTEPFTLKHVADSLLDFMVQKDLHGVHVVGHSLGGYVALAMVKTNPSLFASLTLFHSTAYADTLEKKESRAKAIEFVKKNGSLPFTSGFIPPLFANPTHPAVAKVREIASQASSGAIMGYTQAMKDREEEIKTLEIFKNPTLFIAGEKDPGIPVDAILKQASHCQKPEIHILEKVAHMGMFEKPGETAGKIKDFVSKTHTKV
jgi:pimeloyl-ACP methyl ester carboxylesterase